LAEFIEVDSLPITDKDGNRVETIILVDENDREMIYSPIAAVSTNEGIYVFFEALDNDENIICLIQDDDNGLRPPKQEEMDKIMDYYQTIFEYFVFAEENEDAQ
jgi:hypothetical protein